ncbi:BTB/POZ and MATH domain-containing protein 2 [Rhynchospora pubera]|uniref:BTB/POZ and MATH domain-containing protein 2 n=1 Tax=Rhynchospora pubera TaxID=906938 RepID=A0AAV8F5G7_9POAL|nr:BTB/POZ and MATH domain-containing protein 2 [Rhynchospora pubera]
MMSEKGNSILESFLRCFPYLAIPVSPSKSRLTVENVTSSMITTEEATGSHLFKIKGHSVQKLTGRGHFLKSATFKVGGYNWYLMYYPNEDDCGNSIYLCLKSSQKEGNVRASWTFTVLDQNERQLSQSRTSDIVTFNGRLNRVGLRCHTSPAFWSWYLKDDCVVLKCTVTVVKESFVDSSNPIVMPPSKVQQQLGHLLRTGYEADVNFEVDGEIFGGHKCIIHARSPVFSETYFGLTKEKFDTKIRIKEMKAPVFKALLHFIYNDSFSGFKKMKGNDETQDSGLLTQELMVVADRYGLERLRIMCEKTLSHGVDINNVVSLLSFAQSHSYNHLKASCLKFLASPDTFGAVVETEQFQYLVRCHPLILKELLEKRDCN